MTFRRLRGAVAALALVVASIHLSAQVIPPPPEIPSATPAPAPAAPAAAPAGEAPAKSPGQLLVALQQYAQALPLLDEELKTQPKEASLHLAKVEALQGLQRYGEAKAAALQGLFANPTNGELRFEMGHSAFMAGLAAEALQTWKPLLADGDWGQAAVVWSSRGLRALGREAEARELVLGALAKAQKPATGLLEQALLLDPSVAGGLKYIDRLIEVDPADREDYQNLRKLYEQVGTGTLFELSLPGGTPAVLPIKEKSEVKSFSALDGYNSEVELSSATRVVMPVQFPGAGKGKEVMVLDSGSDVVLVSPNIVKKLGLQAVSTAEYVGLGYKGSMASQWVILRELQVGPLTIRNLPAMVIDKETDFWKETAGILPLSIFRQYGLLYDRRGGKLTLYPTGTKAEAALGANFIPAAFLWAGRSPYVQVRVQTSPPVFFLLDTGASSTFVDGGRAESFGIKVSARYGSQGISGMSGGLHSGVARDVVLQLGRARINLKGVQVAELGGGGTLDSSGILGRDILDLFSIYIDYGQNTLAFKGYDR